MLVVPDTDGTCGTGVRGGGGGGGESAAVVMARRFSDGDAF